MTLKTSAVLLTLKYPEPHIRAKIGIHRYANGYATHLVYTSVAQGTELALWRMAGLYIHIPFCRQACHYCDFHFSTQQGYRTQMVQAMVKELELMQSFLPQGQQLATVYLGGGTPSLLSAAELESIMGSVHKHYGWQQGAEITLEANPDDMSAESLGLWKDMGINRLSIGIQSFQDHLLKACNRAHDATQALAAIPLAQDAGFSNLSLDLMYGLPGSTMESWETDVAQALAMKVPHISAYSLTIETGTAFGRWYEKGKLLMPEEDLVIAQAEYLVEALQHQGYEHYEVSNYALPGQYAVHNTNYWRYEPYLGIGPSAHSFDGTNRWSNVAHNHKYMAAMATGMPDRVEESLSAADRVAEYMLTSLRTQWGLDLAVLKSLGYELDLSSALLQEWHKQGDVWISASHIGLTPKARFMADYFTTQLLPD